MKKNKLTRKLKCKKGQGLVEYLILVALIAVSTIGVIKVVGNNVATQYENINRALGAKNSQKLTVSNASDSSLKQKDLSNFLESSRSNK
jgi:pilus assembly protein Flp/PilA